MWIGNRSITRRTALSSSSCLFGILLSERLVTGSTTSDLEEFERDPAAELYVFPGSCGEGTVVALTWPTKPSPFGLTNSGASYVKIHSGRITWKVDLSSSCDVYSRYENSCRIYAGCVQVLNPSNRGKIAAVVIEAPNHLLGQTPFQVWAERVDCQGKRQRVGSPFLMDIIARNKRLATLYHASSPGQDRALFSQQIATQIARRARLAGHLSDPDSYGRHIASFLLPDVLHYDPKLPPGFTFAAQNGRHPVEDASAIADMILSGVPATSNLPRPMAIRQHFPYLGNFSAEEASRSVA